MIEGNKKGEHKELPKVPFEMSIGGGAPKPLGLGLGLNLENIKKEDF
jgi:hypothetical protein